MKRPYVDIFRRLLKEYRKNASVRGWEFSLDESQFSRLVSGACHYCGKRPARLNRMKDGELRKSSGRYNGIDRVDPSIGYVFSNCVSCCKTCNSIKYKHKGPEMLEAISKMLLHLAKRGLK